jgi:signal transduction histidine kinase
VGNLIDNAYDHGEGNDVQISISVDGAGCAVAVSDRGPGISGEDVPHLFEPFFKADRSRTRERGGVGLGLAIAMANARLLGGSIEAASSPGKGSTFTLRLPLRTASAEEDG